MPDERLIQEVLPCDRQLVIVEKYEDFLNYTYPIAQNIPRKHGMLRDMFLSAVLEQVRLFIEAGKSSQISKLYAADAGLAGLRFDLRFMADRRRGIITPNQARVASSHLAETGKILGAWILSAKRKKG